MAAVNTKGEPVELHTLSQEFHEADYELVVVSAEDNYTVLFVIGEDPLSADEGNTYVDIFAPDYINRVAFLIECPYPAGNYWMETKLSKR